MLKCQQKCQQDLTLAYLAKVEMTALAGVIPLQSILGEIEIRTEKELTDS
jgi:hypothetical protein